MTAPFVVKARCSACPWTGVWGSIDEGLAATEAHGDVHRAEGREVLPITETYTGLTDGGES